MKYLSWTSFPVLFLAAWITLEICLLALRLSTGRDKDSDVSRLTKWAVRPWAIWAVFNILFRWWGSYGFNNRLTFPFYADLWQGAPGFLAMLAARVASGVVYKWGVVVLLVAAALVLIVRFIVRAPELSKGRTAVALILLFLLAPVLYLSVSCLPFGGALNSRGPILRAWLRGANISRAAQTIHRLGPSEYLKDYAAVARKFQETDMHAASHPPGAALSLYWISKALGAKGNLGADRIRYEVGLTIFSALSVFLLFFLGTSLFRSRKVGLISAALWLSMPAAIAHFTYAQDALYAVFFNAVLLFAWLVAAAPEKNWLSIIILGVLLFCLALLNYSWVLAAAMFVAFVGVAGFKARWNWVEYLCRGAIPLALMSVLLGAFCAWWRLDYIGAFLESRRYVSGFYRYTGWYQWVMAYIGGQMELWLMAGSVAVCAFWLGAFRLRRRHLHDLRWPFLLIILGVFLAVITFGPNPLKMEVARCFSWVLAVPLTFAAWALLGQKRPALYAAVAVAVSILTYAGMRLFLFIKA